MRRQTKEITMKNEIKIEKLNVQSASLCLCGIHKLVHAHSLSKAEPLKPRRNEENDEEKEQ